MKVGVIQFPGSNDERDAVWAFRSLGADASLIWHQDTDLHGADIAVLPGGFSYGDYLRCGAIARFAPVMKAVADHAARGGLVLGICNGFQMLTEAGLVPGALLRNDTCSFICSPVHIRVENASIPALGRASRGDVLRIPIKNGEGRYVAGKDTLKAMEDRGQIVFRYCLPSGADGGNPNGSTASIAGVCNEKGNVMGLMPHPERASEDLMGSSDGLTIFTSMIRAAVRA